MKFLHRRAAKAPKPVKIYDELYHMNWAEVGRRCKNAEAQIFPLSVGVAICGVDLPGAVFAAIIGAQSDRFHIADDPNQADALIFAFSGPEVDEWEAALPNKTIVAMLNTTDERFKDKGIRFPWERHLSIGDVDV